MILWLTDTSLMKSGIQRQIISSTLQKAGVGAGQIIFNNLGTKTPALLEQNPRKMVDKFTVAKARKNLDADLAILRPKLIVINDEPTLRVITGQKYTLNTTRGSLYYYNSIPCIVIDRLSTVRWKKYGQFVFELDLAKIGRWATGKQKNEPAFDYSYVKTVDEVVELAAAAKNSTLVSTDTETSSGFITCVTYTYDDRNGKLISRTVPFFDPWEENGAYWREEADEKRVRKLLAELNASSVVKVLQNGTYDCAYFIMEGMPLVNYIVDTQNLMHSIWCEAPKALHNIASYFCDYYTYWKDENKGEKEDDKFTGKDHTAIERYWRYNGLDGYYTYLSAVELLARITKLPWALRNYNSEFRLSVGPCLAASLRGIAVDRGRHQQIILKQTELAEAGAEDMKRLANDPDFNVNAPNDNAWLLYDVCGAKPTRLQRKGSKLGPRSTDEKVLRLMKEQRNFFVSHAIDRILAAKKPAAVVSKYGNWYKLCYSNGRFHSWHGAAGTETFRLNSGNWQYWTGTNAMNFQPFIQEMFVADPNYIFLDADFSASDDWFIAHEAEDEDKIHALNNYDVHSYHASRFFKMDYDKIVRGKKNHEDWVVHAITGVRQIAKKIAHGKNFRMGPTMMYNLMGRDMAVATAKAMGYNKPENMMDKELIGMCQDLCDVYDDKRTGMYKRIRPWQEETTEELKRNGGLATNAFGITRKFFGSPEDHDTQRELSAYFGQSGTSGNANRALNKIFYSGVDDGRFCLFLVQVHDSFKFLIHRNHLDKIGQIKSIMEEPLELKGRKFFVPVACEVGLTDGKKMMPWRPDITYEEIVEHERKTYAEKFPKGKTFIEQLQNFDATALEEELDQLLGTDLDLEETGEPEPLS